MCAPASTWASTSRSTRLKSPAFISSARSLRPVGLIRSPMITNGRSKPMTTSRVAGAQDRVGHVGRHLRCRGRRQRRAAGDAARLDQLGQAVLGVLGLEPLGLGVDLRLDVVAARRDGSCATPRCSRCTRACRPGWRPCRWRPGSAGGGRPCSSRRSSLATTWAGMSRHQMIDRLAMSGIDGGPAGERQWPRGWRWRDRRSRSGDARRRGRAGRRRPRARRSASGSSVWAR